VIASALALDGGISKGKPGHAVAAVWRGDYETDDFSQWLEVQASRTNPAYRVDSVGDSAAKIVTVPVRQGTHAALFVTYPNTGDSADDRSEIDTTVANTGGRDGQDWYYAWSTRFTSRLNRKGFWSKGGDWNVFTQWHSGNDACGNNVQLGVDAATTPGVAKLYTDLTTKNPLDCDQQYKNVHSILGRLRFDTWYDFVVHIKWSTDPRVGFYEVWMNGREVVPRTVGQTMLDAKGVYWKQGFYRGAFDGTNAVYQDGAVRAPSLDAAAQEFRLAFARRPLLWPDAHAVDVSATSFADAVVLIAVRDARGRIVGQRRVRSDGSGSVVATIPVKTSSRRLVVTLRALVSPRLPLATRRAQAPVALAG
jgi:hypothetical protein